MVRFNRNENVLYRQSNGSMLPAKVLKYTVPTNSYLVQLTHANGRKTERETVASRLRKRNSTTNSASRLTNLEARTRALEQRVQTLQNQLARYTRR